MIGDGGSVTGGSQSNGQAHTGVILLSIVVNDGAAQFVALEHREFVEGILLRQVVAGLYVAITGDEIIGFDAHPEVWDLPPSKKLETKCH